MNLSPKGLYYNSSLKCYGDVVGRAHLRDEMLDRLANGELFILGAEVKYVDDSRIVIGLTINPIPAERKHMSDEPVDVPEDDPDEFAEPEEAEGTVHAWDDPEGKWHVKPDSVKSSERR